MKTPSIVDEENEIPAEEAEKAVDFLQMIHDDNSQVAELFFQFSQAEEDDEKREIFNQLNNALTIHAQIGEEILYPLVIEVAESDDEKEEAKELVAEVEAGNYVASLILDELVITETDDEFFDAKIKILQTLVKEMVKKEEKEMFEKLQEADIDFSDLAVEAGNMKSAFVTKSTRKAAGSAKKTKPKAKSAKKTPGAKKKKKAR